MKNAVDLRIVLVLVGFLTLARGVEVRDLYPRHDNYWSGRVMNGKRGFSKHNADMMYGKDPPDDKWQGWTKVDIADIPDNATITQASFFYYVVSQSEPAPHTYVTLVAEDPVSAEPDALWNGIVSGTVVAPDFVSDRDWVERVLSADGVHAIQSALSRDWIAFGLFKWDETESKGHAKGYEAEKFRPYLRVTFAAANMAIDAIIAPAGELESDSVVAPVVAVSNKGDLELSFSLTVTIGDGAAELYHRTLELDAVPVGESRAVTFPEWTADPAGGERIVTATLDLAHDADPLDNYAVSWFTVVPSAPKPRPYWGWEEVRPLPLTGTPKPVRAGAWLAVDETNGIVYAARGGKTTDFFAYNPATGQWQALAPVPGRVGQGARGVSDGKGSVFMVLGGGTQEFWRYSISQNNWERLPDVPLGPSEKKVKTGTDLVHVEQYGLDYIYLLKGPKQNFLRYNVQARTWATLDNAPAGTSAKWKQGSWLTYDSGSKLYAHKAPTHEMWVYDLNTDTWTAQIPPIPYATQSTNYRRKRIKEGASAVWREGAIYSLKSGKTDQFWRFDPVAGIWNEQEPLPVFGTTLKDVKVGQGSDMISYPFSRVLYAFKGNKTFEFWRYTMPPRETMKPNQEAQATMAGSHTSVRFRTLSIYPNPVVSRVATIQSSVMTLGTARVTVFDATGQIALSRVVELKQNGEASLDVNGLSTGTYCVCLDGPGFSLTGRMVVAK